LLAKEIKIKINKLKDMQKETLNTKSSTQDSMVDNIEYKKLDNEQLNKLKTEYNKEKTNLEKIEYVTASFARRDCVPSILWSTGEEESLKKKISIKEEINKTKNEETSEE